MAVLNRLSNYGDISLGGRKNDIAALQVAFDIAETQRLVKLPQFRHFDFLLPADIDATQQGNKGIHKMISVWNFNIRLRLYPAYSMASDPQTGQAQTP